MAEVKKLNEGFQDFDDTLDNSERTDEYTALWSRVQSVLQDPKCYIEGADESFKVVLSEFVGLVVEHLQQLIELAPAKVETVAVGAEQVAKIAPPKDVNVCAATKPAVAIAKLFEQFEVLKEMPVHELLSKQRKAFTSAIAAYQLCSSWKEATLHESLKVLHARLLQVASVRFQEAANQDIADTKTALLTTIRQVEKLVATHTHTPWKANLASTANWKQVLEAASSTLLAAGVGTELQTHQKLLVKDGCCCDV